MHALFEKLSQQKARGVINQVAKHVAWLLYSVFGWVGRLVVGLVGDATLPIDAAAESGVVITYIVISQTQNRYSKLDR